LLLTPALGCRDDRDGDDTSAIGAFDGLFNGVATGLNFPLDIGVGNYGVAVASGTVWFTRANNQNGTLRAITPEQDVLPTTAGPFPPQ